MSSDQSASVGRGRPRRRTTITPIENKNAREVSFTKRRQGLFRKASELAVLCGAEVAIITYSPHQNPFTFGTPSADAVLGRFLGYGAAAGSGAVRMQDAFMSQEREALSRLGEAKKMLKAAGPGSESRWWELDPVDEGFGLVELEHYVDSMERLKDTVARRLEEMTLPTPAAAPSSGSSVEKEEQLMVTNNIPGSTSSEGVHPDLDDMIVFDWISVEEELVPKGNMMFESFDSLNYYNIWDHDFGLCGIEQR